MALELLHVFPSFAPGGIQMRLRTLVSALPDSWCHSVLALDGQYSALESLAWPSNITALEGVLPEDLHTGGSFRR
ncbi:MAG: hypothetical protein AAF337_11075, partial [Pseudomonadota bacterium]